MVHTILTIDFAIGGRRSIGFMFSSKHLSKFSIQETEVEALDGGGHYQSMDAVIVTLGASRLAIRTECSM